MCFIWVRRPVLLACSVSPLFLHVYGRAENQACDGVDSAPSGFGLLQASQGNIYHARPAFEALDSQPPETGMLSIHKAWQALQPIKPKTEQEVDRMEHNEVKLVVCCCLCLVVCLATLHLIHLHGLHFLPGEFVFMLYGVFLGLALKYWAKAEFMQTTNRCIRPSEFMALLFLPPIIFDSGFMMRRLDFMSQLPYIQILAVIGTLINILVIGSLLYLTGQYGLHGIKHYRSTFTIAAAVASVDPGPTLHTFSQVRVEPLLSVMVSGEALLNDLVSVVVFNVLNHGGSHSKGANLREVAIEGTVNGLQMFIGSVSVGAVVGVLHCWLLRLANLHNSKKIEILLVVVTAYAAFALGEFFHVSGIIATLIAGIMTGVYARPHLSMEGSLLAAFFLSQCCTMIELGICLLCGMSILLVWLNSNGEALAFYLIIFCLIGRLLAIFPCGCAINLLKVFRGKNSGHEDPKDWHLLSFGTMFMMWHSGIHGAIALWMSLRIGDWIDELDGKDTRHTVESAVLLTMIVLTGLLGGTTKSCLDFWDIQMGKEYEYDYLSKTELPSYLGRFMKWLDAHVLFPSLVGYDKELSHDANSMARMGRRMDVETLLRHATQKSDSVSTQWHRALTMTRLNTIRRLSRTVEDGQTTPVGGASSATTEEQPDASATTEGLNDQDKSALEAAVLRIQAIHRGKKTRENLSAETKDA